MFYLVTEKDGRISKVAYRSEEEVCIDFFRKVSDIISGFDRRHKVVIENYNCDFGNGTKMYIEKVRPEVRHIL